ncbi:RNA polymerase sigma factor [Aestuariibaculum marinum]|uniref:RNA polymerase sigma-70 factor n=1 Tax=Aestuariibaculum marinum TaxID=2683592 RepID=A0A8J6Q0N5_9FLAO|nr:RNA polymerase sigma-70 factor [Aestuariibaculum marinum]MBD0825481.1 RNA polymerase sigma-70 factor [Aestuariibaculum marinum]
MNNSLLHTDLVINFKNGDKEAFEKIYKLFYQDLNRFIQSYTKDRELSQDLVQNAFLKIWEIKESIDPKENLKSYLYKLVYNSFIDKIRKDKNFNNKIEEIKYQHFIENLEEDKELKLKRLKAIEDSIEILPKKCKEIFILSKYNGLKYQQIADNLGISVNTVKVQISKAYKLLSRNLISKDTLNFFISLMSNRITKGLLKTTQIKNNQVYSNHR